MTSQDRSADSGLEEPSPRSSRGTPREEGTASTSRERRIHPLAVLSFLAIIAAWQASSVVLGETVGYKRVPGIEDVVRSFIEYAGYWQGGLGAESTRTGAEPTNWGATLGLGHNTLVTMLRTIAGYTIGVVTGIGLGFLIAWSKIARGLLTFPAHLARMMPLLAMIPLFALWFGDSELGVLTFIAFAVGILLFAITINAIGNVPLHYWQYARSLGASPLRTYARVVFPAAFPQLRGGLLLAVAFSWSAALAAEFLGQQVGLGHVLQSALYYASTDVVALTGLVVIVFAAVTYLAANKTLAWLTRWAE
ncbi:MAG: ABC transporter permease subunit [bacterium]|nr:ABC transporter permease subunit [bacterium]MDE0288870.1 ABC transporter permease subunit [bacterium]MDE0439762.1 ABC transporter permease subunit [bacterium]